MVGVYNLSVKNEKKCGSVRWTSPFKSGRSSSRGEIVGVLDLGAGGAAVRLFLHVKVFMETL